jgi:predicted amidohydrolase
MAKASIVLGAWQGPSHHGDIAGNLDLFRNVLVQAVAKEIDLVVFPELFLTGYDHSVEDMRSLAISRVEIAVDDQHSHPIRRIQNACVELSIGACVGYPERDGALVFNSCILVDAAGHILLNHRKLSLWDPEVKYEKVLYTPGSTLSCAAFNLPRDPGSAVTVGALVCFDINTPAYTAELVCKGAEIVIVCAAVACSIEAYKNIILPAFENRARENAVCIVVANSTGNCDVPGAPPGSYIGHSSVFAVDGSVLACAVDIENTLISHRISLEYID